MPGMLILLVLCCVALSCVSAFVSQACTNKFRLAPVSGTSLRFLEANSWELVLSDIKVYVDPVMSQLDFGIPRFYAGNKKIIDGEEELKAIASTADVIFISQVCAYVNM
jgi:hypothetical protein